MNSPVACRVVKMNDRDSFGGDLYGGGEVSEYSSEYISKREDVNGSKTS